MVSNKTAKLGIHKIRSIIDQQYVGDINIMPERSLDNFRHLLANPSLQSINRLISQAERTTWTQLDKIERNTKISFTFNRMLEALRQEELERLSGHKNSAIRLATR